MAETKGIAKDIMIMDGRDNVAVCLRDIKADEQLSVLTGVETISLKALDQIPRGHKICLREIQEGSQVIKYGEIIGKAKMDIHMGQYVHVHNVAD